MAKVDIPRSALPGEIVEALKDWRLTSSATHDEALEEGLIGAQICDPDPVDPDISDFAALITETDTLGMADLARNITKDVPPHILANFIDALVASQN